MIDNNAITGRLIAVPYVRLERVVEQVWQTIDDEVTQNEGGKMQWILMFNNITSKYGPRRYEVRKGQRRRVARTGLAKRDFRKKWGGKRARRLKSNNRSSKRKHKHKHIFKLDGCR